MCKYIETFRALSEKVSVYSMFGGKTQWGGQPAKIGSTCGNVHDDFLWLVRGFVHSLTNP